MSNIIKNLIFDLETLETAPEKVKYKGKISVIYKLKDKILARELIKINGNPPGKLFLRSKFIKKHFVKFLMLHFSDEFSKNIKFDEFKDMPPPFEMNFFKVKNIFYQKNILKQKTSISGFKSPQSYLEKKEIAKILYKKFHREENRENGSKKALLYFSERKPKNLDKKILKEYDSTLIFFLGKNENIEKTENIYHIELKHFSFLKILRIVNTISPFHDYFFVGNRNGKFPELHLNTEDVKSFIHHKKHAFFFPFITFQSKGFLTPKFFEKGKSHKEFYFGKYNVSFEDILIHSRIIEDFILSKSFAFYLKSEFLYELMPEKDLRTRKWDAFIKKIIYSISFLFSKGLNGFFSCKSLVIFKSREKMPIFFFYPAKLSANTFKVILNSKKIDQALMVYTGFLLNFIKSVGSGKKSIIFEDTLKLLYFSLLIPFLPFSLFKKEIRRKKFFLRDGESHSFISYDISDGVLKAEENANIKNVFYEINGKPLTYIPIKTKGKLNRKILKDELLLFDSDLLLQKIAELVLDEKSFKKNNKFNYSCEVIVATRDRAGELENLLNSLLKCNTEKVKDFKITVIDSFSKSKEVKKICEKFGVNYLRVNKPGKSFALNYGILKSNSDILFFTDDDAVVEEMWLKNMLENFYDDDVYCVTGFVYPQKIISDTEHLFEGHFEEFSMGGLRRGFLKEEYCYPFNLFKSAKIGTGANMAVRRKAFKEIGLFDLSLSPGTPSKAGEEVDLFFRILKANKKIVYTPDSKAWHSHRNSYSALKKILFNYGISSGAFYTRWFISEFKPMSLLYFFKWNILSLSIKYLKNLFLKNYPPSLILIELMGNILGPFSYIYSKIKSIYLYGLKDEEKKYNFDYSRCPQDR